MTSAHQNIEITKIIYRGNYQILPNPLSIGDISENKGTGGLIAKIQGYKCPRCHGNQGHIFREPDGWLWFCGKQSCLTDDVKSQNKEKKVKESQDVSEIFSIGHKFYGAALSKWRADNSQQELVNRWIKNPSKILIVQGNNGTGKTFLCAAIGNHFVHNKHEFHYLLARKFYQNIQEGIQKGNVQYDTVQNIAKKRIVAFDALGDHSFSEWHNEMFLDFLDYRVNHELPTIITTTMSWDAIKQRLGSTIYGRLFSEENIKMVVSPR